MEYRTKDIILIVLVYLSVIYLAFIGLAVLYLQGGSITERIEHLTNLVFLAFLVTIISRTIKVNVFTTVLIIISDLTLIWLVIDEIIGESILETLISWLIEPGVTFILIGMVVIFFDWLKRIKRIRNRWMFNK